MRILYATDGSEGALAGAGLLARLPLTAESHIHLLAVQQPGEASEGADATGEAFDAVKRVLGQEGGGARVETHVRQGTAAADAILALIQEFQDQGEPVDLVVVGSRGRSAVARFLLGSIAERVARHAPCPVLLARPLRGDLGRALLATDGSGGAERAAEFLLRRFPLPAACLVRVVAVVTPAFAQSPASSLVDLAPFAEEVRAVARQEREKAQQRVDALVAAFAAAGQPADAELREGIPAPELIAAADECQADLIVVGSQGLTGIERFLLGSVSERVLRHAHCSVLLVR